ncbi:MAG: hypothetical protein GY870_17650 [archaeon]|nr:hypothetical protein [archaeon]
MEPSTNHSNLILKQELSNLREEYERQKQKYNAYGYAEEKFNELEEKYKKDKETLLEDYKKITKPAGSRMVLLSDILSKLCLSGGFSKCVLLDTKGMIISDYGESEIDKTKIGAMFALIHNNVNRTIKNLNLDKLHILKLMATDVTIYSSIFEVKDYERDFILTTLSESNSNDQKGEKKKKRAFWRRDSSKILDDSNKITMIKEAVNNIMDCL